MGEEEYIIPNPIVARIHKGWGKQGEGTLIGEMSVNNDVHIRENSLQLECYRRTGDERGEGLMLFELFFSPPNTSVVLFNEKTKQFELVPEGE